MSPQAQVTQSQTTGGLAEPLLDLVIRQHQGSTRPHLRRLWDYYRNEMRDRNWQTPNGRDYTLPQQRGLPPRFAGPATDGQSAVTTHQNDVASGDARWEYVIENDIGWRIHSLVDFMFGKPITIQSRADDRHLGERIERLLRRVFDDNGGIGFFQNLALLGSIYGYVDVLLRVNASEGQIALDLIEAPRSIAVLNPNDYRRLDAFVLHMRQQVNRVEHESLVSRLRHRLTGHNRHGRLAAIEVTQVWTDSSFQRFVNNDPDGSDKRVLTEQTVNRLGRIPLVHIQNLPQPFFYEGLSEVEPLIPLQDELNTRLSDRANRVTFQSFKMDLGKGIERFLERPVGPGQMWQTDNPDASILEFGGDASSPSEELHIQEIRDAMDKTSGVSPVAAGLLRNKIGNLTSENALRVTLLGMLAKTEKKRVTYGQGIAQLCELILHAADVYGILTNDPSQRQVRIDWPSPLPENLSEQLDQAKAKVELGVPRQQVLTELGYADCNLPAN